VLAIDECVLLKVAQEDIAPLLQGNPALMDELARLVTGRRHQLEDLSAESVKVQQNQLLRRMQQIFSTVIW
jgi:hypothetical protein